MQSLTHSFTHLVGNSVIHSFSQSVSQSVNQLVVRCPFLCAGACVRACVREGWGLVGWERRKSAVKFINHLNIHWRYYSLVCSTGGEFKSYIQGDAWLLCQKLVSVKCKPVVKIHPCNDSFLWDQSLHTWLIIFRSSWSSRNLPSKWSKRV